MKYSQFFETKNRREENKLFTCCTDNAPDELRELIQSIHFDYFGGCLPNDWIYETILEAFEALEEDELDNINVSDNLSNYELTGWLHENGNAFAIELCEEAIASNTRMAIPILNVIEEAHFLGKTTIYNAVDDFMREQNENK